MQCNAAGSSGGNDSNTEQSTTPRGSETHNMGALRTNFLQSGSHVPPSTRKSLKKALAGRRRKGCSTSVPQRDTRISGRLSPIEEEPDFVEEIVQKKEYLANWNAPLPGRGVLDFLVTLSK